MLLISNSLKVTSWMSGRKERIILKYYIVVMAYRLDSSSSCILCIGKKDVSGGRLVTIGFVVAEFRFLLAGGGMVELLLEEVVEVSTTVFALRFLEVAAAGDGEGTSDCFFLMVFFLGVTFFVVRLFLVGAMMEDDGARVVVMGAGIIIANIPGLGANGEGAINGAAFCGILCLRCCVMGEGGALWIEEEEDVGEIHAGIAAAALSCAG